MALAPVPALAGPAAPSGEPGGAAATEPAAPAAQADPANPPSAADPASQGQPSPQPDPQPAPPADPAPPEPEQPEGPSGGGAAGAVIASDAEGVDQAREDLEGAALDEPVAGVPERMQPLETAAWWTLFGSVALATTGGVFAGLAEQQEDRAVRLASEVDPDTGQYLLYEEQQSEYEQILDRGEAFQWTARGLLIASGAALVASIVMFGVHGKRTRADKKKKVAATVTPGGFDVRF